MTKVIRAASQNVSPSDDASLFRTIYDDGLFESVSITSAGAALVNIPAMYGIMEGRDFTTDAMQITVELPSSGTGTGSVVVRFDTTTQTVISVVGGLNYSLTYEDINATGTICEMEIASYTASASAVTAITETYNIVNAHTLTECGDTLGSATLTTAAQTVTGAINELDAEVGSMLNWTFVGTHSGTSTAMDLPGSWKELYVLVGDTGASSWCATSYVLYDALTQLGETQISVNVPIFVPSTSRGVGFWYSATKIMIQANSYPSGDTFYISVWYR